MSESHIDDTAPVGTFQPSGGFKEPELKHRRWPWILGAIFIALLLAAGGAFFGYRMALGSRMQRQAGQVTLLATTQYQLGVQDLQAKHYAVARQRFEYVIQIDPNFPGVRQKLTEAMLAIAMVASPTPVITPTIALTPTPDTRGVEELFNQAQQLLRAQNWQGAIDALDALRTSDSKYKSVEADGLYYIALRNRGVDKILKQGNLEGGMYDLALTERFGPLDKEADSYRTWARLYLRGASFWEIDWPKVLEYFGQIYPSLPNLRDGSGYTASERFRIASIKYGDELAKAEKYCEARDQYHTALSMAQDVKLAPTATKVQLICSPPTATPEPTRIAPTVETTVPPVPTDTPTPTVNP